MDQPQVKAPFNGLTPAQAERLDLIQEEAAEVIKAIAKIKRHGYESMDPTGKETGTNRQQLEVELGQFFAVMGYAVVIGDLNRDMIAGSTEARAGKIAAGTYLHHQND